jgi:hypothetical protein
VRPIARCHVRARIATLAWFCPVVSVDIERADLSLAESHSWPHRFVSGLAANTVMQADPLLPERQGVEWVELDRVSALTCPASRRNALRGDGPGEATARARRRPVALTVYGAIAIWGGSRGDAPVVRRSRVILMRDERGRMARVARSGKNVR